MRNMVIGTNLIILLISLLLELTGAGPLARWRADDPYAFIIATGLWGYFVFFYVIFCLVLPAFNFVALLLSPHVRIREQ